MRVLLLSFVLLLLLSGPSARALGFGPDAREMLARAVEARIDHRLDVEAGQRTRRSHSVQSTASAAQLVAEADATLEKRQWPDHLGHGPLGRPGLLYVELCLPEHWL